ncbi:MAG: L,D-transpeptidase family protein [Methyloceanibacter sp.]|uniref:L,D-transpeptidase family protein n=1 Tax=Methyloceanibacter sp. TaxID=1965321 RepID=UPI003D6CE476
MRMTGNEAATAAKRALSTIAVCLGAAAFATTIGVAPADAKRSQKSAPVEEAIPEADAGQPMTLIVSLANQKVDIYRGTTLVTSSSVSSGMRGYATKAGVFSILEKKRHHYSNLYAGAPMPWMQRLTWSGTALHAGVVPGYPASHGCVRLPHSFAPKLFSMTTVGEHVVVARSRVAPKLIEHTALFQPLPPPAPPVLVEQDGLHLKRQSSNETEPTLGATLPVILAKAQTDDLIADPPQPEVTPEPLSAAKSEKHAAVETPPPTQASVSQAIFEDTRVHAIDPNAGPSAGGSMHAVATPPVSPAQHAGFEASQDLTKDQERLGGDALPVPSAALPNSGETEAAKGESTPGQTVAAVALAEPQAGPILTVLATALAQPVSAPVSGVLAMLVPDAHPPVPLAKPSAMAAKLIAGVVAAGVEAAEPRSTAPLRILLTRRTQRDRMIDVQHALASLGYLETQDFDGTFGTLTSRAIKAFQKDNGMPETGAFTDDVVKKIYEVAGKEEPPAGHLFVRQQFASVFDTAIRFRNPDEPLGTHLFTVMKFEPGDTKAQWMAVSLQDGDDPAAVLDRIEIPDDIRQNLSERLTPGSSLIIADTAINSATLPKGADFLVWDTSKSATVQKASLSEGVVEPRPKKKRRVTTTRRRTPTVTYNRNTTRPYRGWPF